MKMTDLQKLAAAVQQQQEQEQVLRKVAAIQKLAALEEIAQMTEALKSLRKEANAATVAQELLPVLYQAPKKSLPWGKILAGLGITGTMGGATYASLKGRQLVEKAKAEAAAKAAQDEALTQYGLGTGVGALGGAGLGAAIADNPTEGAMYGALAGAPAGAGATYLARLAKEKGWV